MYLRYRIAKIRNKSFQTHSFGINMPLKITSLKLNTLYECTSLLLGPNFLKIPLLKTHTKIPLRSW